MDDCCREKGIKREYIARTPQQNVVAERKNRTLIEATRNNKSLINGSNLKEIESADQQVNTASPGPSPASEDSHIEDQEIELGNIHQSYEVPTTPHTRIYKDHPIKHVIGDVPSHTVQTRRRKLLL
ncbi:putative ribonuclease H-like domain-containing protein [Tanacetum coccineum]|uniref:Ribonuclease H-like domain-containing protein n=1 Tax=Tanacetum coccineum TaxID=301880 RepID=A0ABQ4Z670_9ASTR